MNKTEFNPEPFEFRAIVWVYEPRGEEAADMAADMSLELADQFGVMDVDFENYSAARDHATPGGKFDTRGTCDHCGAHFHYGARFTHAETGESMIVGNVCASNTMGLTGHEYGDKLLRQKVKMARSKAAADLAIRKLAPNRREALSYDHGITFDIRSKFRKWHSLSVKQWALVKKIKREGEEMAAKRAAEAELLTPIPADVLDGRAVIEGKLLTTKLVDGYYGQTYKMLVLDDRGFKVWGTVPSSIDADIYNGRADGKDLRVSFVAAITKSDDDDTFGFFKRPTKAAAEILEAA